MDPLYVARILVCAFFAACFLQSGLDKLSDWKGNLEFVTGHFSKTLLKGTVPMMLGTITLIELGAGVGSAIGAVMLALHQGQQFAVAGLSLAGLALTMLFAGQRIAKDYAGAVTLATYMGVDLIGLFLLST